MRVLIVRALKLGDFLTAVPAYRAVRRAFPHAHITLAAPREFAELADVLDGAIDEIADVRGLDEPLPRGVAGADLGINLHGRGPQSHRRLLDARPARLLAFRHPAVAASGGGPAFDPTEHEVVRWCRLLRAYGIPAHPDDLDLAPPGIAVPFHVRGATLVHPGAASAARCWPAERWAAVARSELRLGRRVIVTGGPAEIDLARRIAAEAGVPSGNVYAGRTGLRELAALVAAAARVVCGDTGVAHLATAYRRPSVVLFGPTPPAQWGPPPRPYHRVLWNGTTGDPHADRVDPGLRAISVERVIEALRAP